MPGQSKNINALPSLRKLASLRVIGQTPVSERFNQELVDQWEPLIKKLVAKYDMRGRMSDDDLRQELIQQIWKLTQRIDPVSQPDDFRRMCRTELRNKCVDLSRWIKAQKRMGRTGKGASCTSCGVVSHIHPGHPVECAYCGPGTTMVSVDMLAREASIDSVTEASPSVFARGSYNHDEDNVLVSEMIEQVRFELESDNLTPAANLLELLVNPTPELFELMEDRKVTCDHRTMVLSVYAEYFSTTERDISGRMRSIREAVVSVCGEELGAAFAAKLSR